MPDTAISDRLRTLKNERGITAQQMSDQTGIPQSTLEKYMLRNGAMLPGIEAVQTICSVFDVSADWLLGLAERPNPAIADAQATEIAAQAVIEQFVASINHTQKYMGDVTSPDGSISGVFRDGLLYGAAPGDQARDHVRRVLSLRAAIMEGNVAPDITVEAPGKFSEGKRAFFFTPEGTLKFDET